MVNKKIKKHQIKIFLGLIVLLGFLLRIYSAQNLPKILNRKAREEKGRKKGASGQKIRNSL